MRLAVSCRSSCTCQRQRATQDSALEGTSRPILTASGQQGRLARALPMPHPIPAPQPQPSARPLCLRWTARGSYGGWRGRGVGDQTHRRWSRPASEAPHEVSCGNLTSVRHNPFSSGVGTLFFFFSLSTRLSGWFVPGAMPCKTVSSSGAALNPMGWRHLGSSRAGDQELQSPRPARPHWAEGQLRGPGYVDGFTLSPSVPLFVCSSSPEDMLSLTFFF